MSDEIDGWLNSLGLAKYADAFRENDVDIRALRHMTEADLRELGISLGHRKIIIASIASLGGPTGSATISDRQGAQTTKHAEGAERRLLTVMFCDLVGSTSLFQKMDPEDVRELLRRYQDAVAGTVTRYGGYVAKYLGDGVLAYFGWPMAHEDHAERAVRAGLETLAEVQKVQAVGQKTLDARIGIATGQVVVGDLVGTTGRELSAVAGHTPNLAARLQQHAGPGQLLISEPTLRLIGDAFVTESLEKARLKGFEEAVPLYLVLSEREVDSRFAAVRRTSSVPLIGRVHELGLLRDRWAVARAGRGQVVFISGEAGIGKSRLVQALEEEVKTGDHELVRLQCSPYHQSSAFHPVIQRLSRAAGLMPEHSPVERLERLELLLKQNGEELTSVVPIYAELLSLDTLSRYRTLDFIPNALKDVTLQILVDRLALISQRHPPLIILEDAHWIDPSTAELLERIFSRIADLPAMLIVTHRPEWSPPQIASSDNVTVDCRTTSVGDRGRLPDLPSHRGASVAGHLLGDRPFCR